MPDGGCGDGQETRPCGRRVEKHAAERPVAGILASVVLHGAVFLLLCMDLRKADTGTPARPEERPALVVELVPPSPESSEGAGAVSPYLSSADSPAGRSTSAPAPSGAHPPTPIEEEEKAKTAAPAPGPNPGPTPSLPKEPRKPPLPDGLEAKEEEKKPEPEAAKKPRAPQKTSMPKGAPKAAAKDRDRRNDLTRRQDRTRADKLPPAPAEPKETKEPEEIKRSKEAREAEEARASGGAGVGGPARESARGAPGGSGAGAGSAGAVGGGSGNGVAGGGDAEGPGRGARANPVCIYCPPREYPSRARREGREGTVLVEALVGPTGAVVETRIAGGSGHAVLDEAARDAVKKWRFRPGQKDGKNVAMWVRIPMSFRLR